MAHAEYKKWLEPDNLTKLRSWARDGLTNEQIAKKIGVKRQTFQRWLSTYSDMSDALKKGKEIVDAEIEDSLISIMKKHTITTTQYKMVKKDAFNLKAERSKFANIYKLDHPNATKEEVGIAVAEHVDVYEKIPISKTVTEVDPNASAIIFWLKNRRPDIYRDQTFQKLNEANARKTLAEAQLSEAQLKAIEESDDPSNKTIIVDDIREVKSDDSNSETESRD
ncbi:helix-turn-helix domain-containing protein [Lactobacillus johnsonii]|uniref:helix-turn-helix domain-containing protein n=1 Tax=Lactobacillus johnsonii TaxID=33959 RepID=UPI003654884D